MESENSIYLKFPAILRDKLKSGEIVFPDSTEYQYEPIHAFRGVDRDTDDYHAVDRSDFKSHAERGIKKVRGRSIDTSVPEYYGVSLFRKPEPVENALHFPNPKKKMAHGFVYAEGGPQLTNSETEHVCWWLYLDTDLRGFSIRQEGEKNE